uniref:NAC domain-containing protein n=1 Tax=Heterorhabditis bacteriophora TaxID=37862 RepID=A0A1I7WK15_HETBA
MATSHVAPLLSPADISLMDSLPDVDPLTSLFMEVRDDISHNGIDYKAELDQYFVPKHHSSNLLKNESFSEYPNTAPLYSKELKRTTSNEHGKNCQHKKQTAKRKYPDNLYGDVIFRVKSVILQEWGNSGMRRQGRSLLLGRITNTSTFKCRKTTQAKQRHYSAEECVTKYLKWIYFLLYSGYIFLKLTGLSLLKWSSNTFKFGFLQMLVDPCVQLPVSSVSDMEHHPQGTFLSLDPIHDTDPYPFASGSISLQDLFQNNDDWELTQ